MYAAGNEQWTKDLRDYPEWDTSCRLASATETALIVGGTALVLGGISATVGGIAGGAFVGHAMGDFGEDLGKTLKSNVDEGSAAQDAFHQAWTWSSDVVEGTCERVFG
ncbi:hypothetical protein [Curtobacterium sp. Leaf261]|uniref:hypothetical protein n=1 Tax=Curtobacterium sp. Leaf261 TaxID=1736311 RepID=UPI0012E12198|nr:hypothetical protein [Curtobacterium sp. Leaf261]